MNLEKTRRNRDALIPMIILIIVCLAINAGGSALADALGTPFYFDCIGIILGAALGGYIPGVIIGFATNVIGGISDSITLYYSVISILIAIAAAYFSQKKYLQRIKMIIIPIIVFTAIGGVLGSVLTWFVYGGAMGTTSTFLEQLGSDALIDLGDKAIVTIVAALILWALPGKIHVLYNVRGWRNKKKSNIKIRGMSLNTGVIVIVTAATIIMAIAVSFISGQEYHDTLIDDQAKHATEIAVLGGSMIDGDKVDEYIELGEKAEGYTEVKDQLEKIKASADDIEYLYAYKIMDDGCHVVFDLDTEDTPGGQPGDLVEFDESFAEYIPTLLAGGEIAPIVTNDTYGWLLTVYIPVYDSEGNCACYMCTDISMPMLMSKESIFITQLLSLFLACFLVILTVVVYVTKYRLIEPINAMARATEDFRYDSDEAREKTLEEAHALNIHTGDEIENLYNNLTVTVENVVYYIAEDQKKSKALNDLQHGLIFVLADIVESRDKCTGDHIKNTAAYVRIILDQMKKEGIYADQLTDRFVEDVVNSAPLHDIGKIMVPDKILNKPGKLDDAEFEEMKYHAKGGGIIIDDAISKLDSENIGYLNEAKNLAECHHEKWDGSGYPYGLKGEEIPLSARIMAVADVFDALVSKRSYKEGMPFDKAMSIIRESSGSHFDPQIAKAFMDAEEEVRKVSRTQQKIKEDAAAY